MGFGGRGEEGEVSPVPGCVGGGGLLKGVFR